MSKVCPPPFNSSNQKDLETYSVELLSFVAKYAKSISDRCTVDLFVEFPNSNDLDRYLLDSWDIELIHDTKNVDDIDEFANALTSGCGFPSSFVRMGNKITSFIKKTQSLSLNNCIVQTKKEGEEKWSEVRHALELGAKPKKRHEVRHLCPIIDKLSKCCEAQTVFDIGSGQGHLDRMLALKYSLRVVGVEMSSHNAKVATKRAVDTLETVTKRKKQNGVLWREAYQMCRRHRLRRVFREWRGPRPGDDKDKVLLKKVSKSTPKQVMGTKWIENEKKTGGGVKSVPVFIGPDTSPQDLWKFVGTHRDDDDEDDNNAILVGLHPCGDLSCAILRLFVDARQTKKTRVFKGMCLVSCCYHLLQQQDKKHGTYRNFPMSKHLLKRRADASPIGQASFNLACHMFRTPLDGRPNIENLDFKLRLKKLMFRAALQKYVHDRFPKRMSIVVQSRVRWHKTYNTSSFAEYVRGVTISKRASLRNVIKEHEMESDHDINLYYEKNIRPRSHQLAIIINLRCLFAPVIEALILVDRALYVMESGLFHVEMCPLFDSRLSPRSVAIMAWLKGE
jgi:hypothetical protein